jgi:hypothetical protein
MWKPVLRALLPIAVFLGALGLLIYGARFHFVPVSQEEEIEVSIAPPTPFVPPPIPGQPPFGQPGEGPLFVDPFQRALPPFLQTIKAKVIVTENESEPTLIREVTFGGVARPTSGILMRTYTGQPPSLCPT